MVANLYSRALETNSDFWDDLTEHEKTGHNTNGFALESPQTHWRKPATENLLEADRMTLQRHRW